MRQRNSSQSGFSLIEVLVAISVFVFGMMAIASVQVDSISHNASSNTRSVSVSLAQGVMEQVLALDEKDNIFEATTTGMVWDLDPDSAATSLDIPGAGTYNATWDVTTDDPVNQVARVVVTVTGPRGRTAVLTGYKRFE